MAWKDKIRTVFQGNRNEIELGCGHTIKSHGSSVARIHMHDWLILLLLVVIEIVLYVIGPFYRYVGKDMMTDLRYPMKDNTVPVWSVPLYAILLPIIIFVFIYLRRRDVYDLHHSILGLLFAVLITAVITDAIKNAVGRPRPDFFWRCFPDGKDEYDRWGNVKCHGKESDIKEGHKSFPSGHTSWSFAGLGFLSLYLAGKIKAFDRRGHVAKLCIVLLPLLMASLVGVSRVDDYWHHWQDVFTGGMIGLFVATFCYLQFFPAPYHTEDSCGTGPSQTPCIARALVHRDTFQVTSLSLYSTYCISRNATAQSRFLLISYEFSFWFLIIYAKALHKISFTRLYCYTTTTTTNPLYSHKVGSGEGKMYAVHTATSEEVERLFPIDPRLKIKRVYCYSGQNTETNPICSFFFFAVLRMGTICIFPGSGGGSQ
ncbi:hypothetical protein P3L10_034353 [Capsicum annuum]